MVDTMLTMDHDSLINDLLAVVGPGNVLSDPDELMAYECDGFPIAKGVPAAVVFPTSTDQVAGSVRVANRYGVEIVPRGTGTGLTGACVAYDRGVIICTSRMRRILSIDIANRVACVEAGVRNVELTEHVVRKPGGARLHFAPDPSSQRASTIGGNTATNAGGLHTLKYGVTTNHVLGMEMVLADGSLLETRCGPLQDGLGPDLPRLICGSEGTLGIITKIWVRLTHNPTTFRTAVAIFESSADCSQAVADIIGAGIVPAALEMMDGPMVRCVEDAYHFGFPLDAAALLLIELDGVEATLDEQMDRVVELCRGNKARDVQRSDDPARRADLWSARKKAFGAVGRISPSYCTQDACIPRSTLPKVLQYVAGIGAKYGLTITNVFHAGDGNIHPIILFDEDDPAQVDATIKASYEILEYCIALGGALSGEHGIGVEKLPLMAKMFDAATMTTFTKLKHTFDPEERINAGKKLPSDRLKIDLLHPVGAGVPGGAMVA